MNNSKLKVGIYLRLSNEDRNKIGDVDSESIKNQRNMLLDYINKNKEMVLVDEYSDEDLSGAGTYRPEFERLIKDCEKRKIDIVLCKSQSRFSRDMEIVEKYINNKFKEWNIRFIGISDNADTLNNGNKKSRQINGLVNEWYLEDVSNNIRSAFNSKMKQGEFISPFAPYGYDVSTINNNKLVIDEYASLVVKKIYNLYLKGYGYTKISKYLNDNNISSPSLYKYKKGCRLNVVSNKNREDIKWNNNAIKKILTNEIYIGNLIQGKRTTISYKNHKIINKPKSDWIRIENTHDAIIDNEIFNKVQNAIKERTKQTKYRGIVHIFSGKVFCLECKHYMRKKNSSKHEYLVCSKTQNSNCNNTSVRYDLLNKIILEQLNIIINKYFDFNIIKCELVKYDNNNCIKNIDLLTKEKNKIEKELYKNKIYLKKLYEDKVNNVISINQFNELVNCYINENDMFLNKIKLIDKEINLFKFKKISSEDIIKKYNKFEKLNRVIVEEFVDKIYIDKVNNNERKIEIKWNF